MSETTFTNVNPSLPRARVVARNTMKKMNGKQLLRNLQTPALPQKRMM